MKAVNSQHGDIIRMSQHCEVCANYHQKGHRQTLLDQLGCGVVFLCLGVALTLVFWAYGSFVR